MDAPGLAQGDACVPSRCCEGGCAERTLGITSAAGQGAPQGCLHHSRLPCRSRLVVSSWSDAAAACAHLFQCRLSHHMCSQLSVTGRGPPPSCTTRIISLEASCKGCTKLQSHSHRAVCSRHCGLLHDRSCRYVSHQGIKTLTSHIRGTCPRIASRFIPASLQQEAM